MLFSQVLLGGIVIYALQKKIDATIQRSLFEHQTKFTLNHAKVVETLETLFKRFVIVNDIVSEAIDMKQRSRKEDRQWEEKIDHARALLRDFWNYYRGNRLFLPDVVTGQMDDQDTITEYALLILLLTLGTAISESSTIWHDEGPPNITSEWKWDPSQQQAFSMEVDGEIVHYDTPDVLIEQMCKQLNNIANFLEASYKSVAEDQ